MSNSSKSTRPVGITRGSHIVFNSLLFFIAYTFKGQVHVFAGRVKTVSHSSCRTSAILKYSCPLMFYLTDIKKMQIIDPDMQKKKKKIANNFNHFLSPKLKHVLGGQKNRLIEMVLLSTITIFFG